MIRPQHVTPSIYRAPTARDWREVEIVAAYPNDKFVVREVGRPLPGVFLAARSDLRVDAGVALRMSSRG